MSNDIIVQTAGLDLVVQTTALEVVVAPVGVPGAGGALGYYGAFSDYTDQTIPANTAQAMTFNTTDAANGVTVVSGSRVTFANTGTYNVQWSGQFECADNQDQDVSVWLRLNGTDVTGSTGLVSIPAKHGAVNGHSIAGWNFVLNLTANDYIQFYWSATSALVSLQTYPAATSPTRPSTASLILTAQQVMYTMAGPAGDPGVFVGPTAPANTALLWVDTSV